MNILGAVTAKLPGNCEIIRFDRGLQPVYTLAFGCQGMDMIRLWPSPVQKLWSGDFDSFRYSGGKCEDL